MDAVSGSDKCDTLGQCMKTGRGKPPAYWRCNGLLKKFAAHSLADEILMVDIEQRGCAESSPLREERGCV